MYDLNKRQEMRNVEVKEVIEKDDSAISFDDSPLDDDYYDGQLKD